MDSTPITAGTQRSPRAGELTDNGSTQEGVRQPAQAPSGPWNVSEAAGCRLGSAGNSPWPRQSRKNGPFFGRDQQLEEMGVALPPPDDVADAELPGKLREIFEALASVN